MGGEPRYAFLSVAFPDWTDSRWKLGFFRGARAHGVEIAGGDLSRAASFYCDVTVLGDSRRGESIRRDTAKPGDFIYVSGKLGKPRKRIQPRLALGLALRGVASACMDLSDGLSIDLARLTEASGVGAELTGVPVARGATVEDAFHRGEDYELLFTSPKQLPHPQIGRIVEKRGVRYRGQTLTPRGWDHFASKD